MSHTDGKPRDHAVSNLATLRSIATEAGARVQAELEHVRVRSDAGSAPNLDRAFRDSLIAIAFAGMAIEATLWIVGCAKLGEPTYKLIDKSHLEDRLAALGISDPQLLGDAIRLRLVCAELLHEKPEPLGREASTRNTVQDEAARAVALMARIEGALGVPRPT